MIALAVLAGLGWALYLMEVWSHHLSADATREAEARRDPEPEGEGSEP